MNRTKLQLRIEMLEESVARYESKEIEQEEQIASYKQMHENVQEDYKMAMEQYDGAAERGNVE